MQKHTNDFYTEQTKRLVHTMFILNRINKLIVVRNILNNTTNNKRKTSRCSLLLEPSPIIYHKLVTIKQVHKLKNKIYTKT